MQVCMWQPIHATCMHITYIQSHVVLYYTTGNSCTLNILDNIQVLNNTNPDNVLLTCVDGFTPEEVILVQCINGAWHPDPATVNCTAPIRESGKEHFHSG